MCYNLQSYSLEDEAEEDGFLEAVPFLDKDSMRVSQNYACVNSLLQSESNDKSMIRAW